MMWHEIWKEKRIWELVEKYVIVHIPKPEDAAFPGDHQENILSLVTSPILRTAPVNRITKLSSIPLHVHLS